MKPELNHGKVIDFVEARNLTQLSRRRLEIDLERYQTYIDDNELSEEEKADFVNALWTVIVAFVDLGYGVHGVCQRCCPPISCGVSDFRDADFGFWVKPDGSGGLPVAGFA